jgi:hypothetical protein
LSRQVLEEYADAAPKKLKSQIHILKSIVTQKSGDAWDALHSAEHALQVRGRAAITPRD